MVRSHQRMVDEIRIRIRYSFGKILGKEQKTIHVCQMWSALSHRYLTKVGDSSYMRTVWRPASYTSDVDNYSISRLAEKDVLSNTTCKQR